MGLMDTLRGWFGTAKETASEAAEKAKPHVEKAVETAKDVASDLGEKAGDLVDKGKEAAAGRSEDVADSPGEASDTTDPDPE